MLIIAKNWQIIHIVDEFFVSDIMNLVTQKAFDIHCYGHIAQLVEQRPFKPMVGGSNPSVPTR
ncbi:MAG: hypothetical protein US63_C0026G0025 [Candidatus Moranbacteria bacterium GW2011_GWC2_37_8]|nr:MAG: hypothetical protein US63_C0026G0025 [Candidatus Moranbacteria bacterium GW2011_GWC2_37_8]KKQ62908.1 MAG: hypothetical protein US82_C0004G0025 [Parcubacteria group bacterium GW2011_GWC1_38_22]KKQ81462.1 MAG: hypothetical protein UT03_C0001G0002 [Candidatus Moranbacteria bacterium GW2011_GWD2_38_7]